MSAYAAHAREIADHYRAKGWRGQALAQRLAKHANALAANDPDVSACLMASAKQMDPRLRK